MVFICANVLTMECANMSTIQFPATVVTGKRMAKMEKVNVELAAFICRV
jgi:hypothetical protein